MSPDLAYTQIPVAVRLVGGSDHKAANAGKPVLLQMSLPSIARF